MQAVGFVKHAVWDGGSPFADMDKGGLAQSGEEFVRRLGRKDRGTVLGMIFGIPRMANRFLYIWLNLA